MPQKKTAPAATASIVTNQISEVTIRSATFGMGDRVADVTDRVRELLRSKPRGFSPTSQVLGVDPLPKKKKQLVIQYDFKEAPHTLTVQAPKTLSYQTLLRHAKK